MPKGPPCARSAPCRKELSSGPLRVSKIEIKLMVLSTMPSQSPPWALPVTFQRLGGFGGLEAWRLGGLEVRRLGGLDALMPRRTPKPNEGEQWKPRTSTNTNIAKGNSGKPKPSKPNLEIESSLLWLLGVLLGAAWVLLGASWLPPGASWGPLGCLLRPLGCLLGPLGGLLGAS